MRLGFYCNVNGLFFAQKACYNKAADYQRASPDAKLKPLQTAIDPDLKRSESDAIVYCNEIT
jgi:hypothetical protein